MVPRNKHILDLQVPFHMWTLKNSIIRLIAYPQISNKRIRTPRFPHEEPPRPTTELPLLPLPGVAVPLAPPPQFAEETCLQACHFKNWIPEFWVSFIDFLLRIQI